MDIALPMFGSTIGPHHIFLVFDLICMSSQKSCVPYKVIIIAPCTLTNITVVTTYQSDMK